MKKILYAIFLLTCFGACRNEEAKPAETTGKATLSLTGADGDLWAEHVRSQAEIIKPAEWDSTDWCKVNKFIDNRKIVTTILDAVRNGKLKAYDPFDEAKELTREELAQITNTVDTVPVDPAQNDGIVAKVVTKDLPNSITNIRFIEDWYFDAAKLHMSKRVTAIVFAKSAFDDGGSFIGLKPLLLVKLNN